MTPADLAKAKSTILDALGGHNAADVGAAIAALESLAAAVPVSPAAVAGGAPEPMLQFFGDEHHKHLRADMAAVTWPFCELARRMAAELPRNPERTACLRKLLEAKDCGVRARMYKDEPPKL